MWILFNILKDGKCAGCQFEWNLVLCESPLFPKISPFFVLQIPFCLFPSWHRNKLDNGRKSERDILSVFFNNKHVCACENKLRGQFAWKSNLSQCCLKSCSNLKSRPLQNRDRLRRVSADQSRLMGKKKESWNLFWLKFDRKRWQLVLHHWPLTRRARSSWIWPESPFLDRSCIGKDNKRKRIIEF